ncbi:MAG: hypothetical protein H6872_00690 [Methylobacteriaceae bacterium]|nr:hypothetical protein [Methylobacteriaceae bacterium]
MLDVTSTSVRAYCDLQGYEYETFRGLKVGSRPQDATYNRIALLNESLDAGFDGWLVFLDTDAFVVDLDFDLDAYLTRHSDRALVLRPSIPGAQDAWRVNVGVLLVNASHPLAVRAMRVWRRLLRVARATGQLSLPWRYALVDDQKLLQFHLMASPATRRAIHYEDPALINGADATFIAHYLLSDIPDLDMRVAMIAARIDRAFAEAGVDPAPWRT